MLQLIKMNMSEVQEEAVGAWGQSTAAIGPFLFLVLYPDPDLGHGDVGHVVRECH
jgi:hypothetical protein